MAQVSSDASLASEISSALVSITKGRTGKGSPRAKTYVGDDLIVCVRRDGLTPIERTLRKAGDTGEIRRLRDALHERFRTDFVPVVETLTGQRVISFLRDYDVERDICVDCFVLEPDQGGPPKTVAAHADPVVLGSDPALSPCAPPGCTACDAAHSTSRFTSSK